MPPVVARKLMASRSQQSSANATRTRSPLSQPISKPSHHPTRLRSSTAMRPSAPLVPANVAIEQLGEQLVWGNAMPTSHQAYRHTRLEGLFDHANLLRGRPAPTTLNRRDDLNAIG